MALEAIDLVREVKNIVSLPTVYTRLREVIAIPRSSASDIGRVVSEDPGLTARILKLVNSAFFGFPSKIDTVSRAITLVGTQQLSDLALATSVMTSFENIPEEIVSMDSFWQHSLACGVFSRVLAMQRGEDNVERYFVAGLLHDLGRLIIFMSRPNLARKFFDIANEKQLLLIDAEKEVLGFNHADVGHELLKMWNLPGNLQEAVGYHHQPAKAVRYPVEAAAVHIADVITNALKMGSSGERFVPRIRESAWERLRLKIDILPEVIDESERQFEDAVTVFLKNK